MMRSKVDLPEPDWPSSATISPCFRRKSTPSSTERELPSADLKLLATFFNSMSTVIAALPQKCMRCSARRYRRRQTQWFKLITNTHITPMPKAMRGKSPMVVMCWI